MRFVILLLSVFLVSCATPKTQPQAYYGGVYAPGKVEFSSNGSFEATAGVFSEDNLATARKAAYARLMTAAKSKGYRTFKVTDENTTSVFGKTIRLVGRAYKSDRTGGNVYRVDAIKRLLNDLPLEEPKPVIKVAKTSTRKGAPTPIATMPVSIPEQVPSEEPTVIMAPTDITGSITKTNSPADLSSAKSIQNVVPAQDNPTLSNIPKGVVFRTQ